MLPRLLFVIGCAFAVTRVSAQERVEPRAQEGVCEDTRRSSDQRTTAASLYSQAQEAEEQRDLARAIRLYEESLGHFPHATTHNRIGILHEDRGHWFRATEAYLSALACSELTGEERAEVQSKLARVSGRLATLHIEGLEGLPIEAQIESIRPLTCTSPCVLRLDDLAVRVTVREGASVGTWRGHPSRGEEISLRYPDDFDVAAPPGHLVLDGEPVRARVDIDGEESCRLPCNVDVAPGERAISVQGDAVGRTNATIVAGQTLELTFPEDFGSASVRATGPANAHFRFGEVGCDQLPCRIYVEPGRVRVAILVGDDDVQRFDLRLGAGDHRSIAAREPRLGGLSWVALTTFIAAGALAATLGVLTASRADDYDRTRDEATADQGQRFYLGAWVSAVAGTSIGLTFLVIDLFD